MNDFNKNEGYIFGRNNVIEAIKSERPLDKVIISETAGGSAAKIITLAKEKKIPVVRLAARQFKSKFDDENHQGVAAAVAVKEYSSIDDIFDLANSRNEKPFIVIADEIADPHNLGAIIRSAECFGAHGVIISKRRAVGLTASVEKSAGGALNYMIVAKVNNLAASIDQIKERGVWVYCCDMDGDKLYYDEKYDCPLALVVGNEGKGVSKLIKSKCDFIIKIPMRGKVNCLNASVAAAVVMQEISKNR